METAKNTPLDRNIIEETLLEAKGVISFTFDVDASRVTVRYRNEIPADRLFKKLATLRGIKTKQVVRGASGDEVLIDLFSTKENENRINREPAYLDDEDDVDPTGKYVERTERSSYSISMYQSIHLYFCSFLCFLL